MNESKKYTPNWTLLAQEILHQTSDMHDNDDIDTALLLLQVHHGEATLSEDDLRDLKDSVLEYMHEEYRVATHLRNIPEDRFNGLGTGRTHDELIKMHEAKSETLREEAQKLQLILYELEDRRAEEHDDA